MTNRNKNRSWRLARNEEPPRKYVVSIRSGKNGIVCNSMAVFAVTVCSVFTKGCWEDFWGCGFLWYWLWGVDDYWNESGWQVLHRGFLSYGRGTEYFDGLPCPMGCTACWLGEEDSPNDRRWKKTLPTIRTVKKGMPLLAPLLKERMFSSLREYRGQITYCIWRTDAW